MSQLTGGVPLVARRIAGAQPSVMAALVTRAKELAAEGTAVIDLAAGVPDFKPDPRLIQAGTRYLRHGHNSYGDSRGVPALRVALAQQFEKETTLRFCPNTEVTVTAGASAALSAALLAFVNPGEGVAMFHPYFESFANQIRLAGGKPKLIPLRAPDWTFRQSDLRRALSGRTRVLILNTPHNPTGRVFSEEELRCIAQVCIEKNVLVISDETYAPFTFEKPHISIAALPGMRQRTIVVTSLSKTFNVSGWRIGTVFANEHLTTAIRRVNELALGAPVPLQEALAAVMPEYVSLLAQIRKGLVEKRDILCAAIAAAGMEPFIPEGTLSVYADTAALGFADSLAACDWLLNEVGILASPGKAFAGEKPSTHVRFSFARDIATIKTAQRALLNASR